MNQNHSIKLKACFLLVVFALNTIVGFACAMGVNMGFNSHHHDDEATEIAEHHHDKKEDSKKDDCCNNRVITLSQADKAIIQSNSLVSPVFFTVFISSYYNPSVSFTSELNASSKYFVRSHHPPIPDIRIAIQSFQI